MYYRAKGYQASPTESVWDFDQRFKTLKGKVIFHMSDIQHKEWFITALFPHIRLPLMQQYIVSQSKSLELNIKLEVVLNYVISFPPHLAQISRSLSVRAFGRLRKLLLL